MGNNPAGVHGAGKAVSSSSYNSLCHKNNPAVHAESHHTYVTEAFTSFGSEVFCIIDESLHWSYLSANWENITGFPVRKYTGKSVSELVSAQDTQKLAEYLMEAEKNASPLRFRMKHADGEWHWCELLLTGVEKNHKLRKASFRCLLRNVNELVIARDDCEKAKLEADIANRSRSEFLANMNHELRTPLNAILGFAQMMESRIYGDIGHPKYHEYVGNIQESGMALLTKINNLVDIANIDSGNMALTEGEHDLVKLIRHAIELHSHRAFAEHITLRDNLPAHPLMAVLDEVRMVQVLGNVISNAIKYNRKGGTVDIYCENRKNGGISVVIEDTGEGIAPGHLERILSAFGQHNSFFARSRDCVGLGLALSKEIVKLHRGKIEIESAPDKGTILRIVLPPERTVKKRSVKINKAKKLEDASADLVG